MSDEPRKVNSLLSVILTVIACLVLVVWSLPGRAQVRVTVPNGLSAGETAELLKREGVIRSVTVFKIFAKVTRTARQLKPGGYLFNKPTPVARVLRQLQRGSVENIKIVVPEGFMAKQIADRLEALEITDSGDFMAYVRENKLEGFLFPTTYHFAKGLPAEKVAHHMHVEFKNRIESIFQKKGQQRFTLKQVVIFASIIQREARFIDEMPTIAAVYSNRLRKRKRLEADPTVQYAMGRDTGKWFKGLRYKHLENRSRYNTYLYSGLPPGPICSPGVEAVKAALNPASVDYIFFVAANDGRHIFTRTLAEHNAARKRVKAERRRLKRRKKRRTKK